MGMEGVGKNDYEEYPLVPHMPQYKEVIFTPRLVENNRAVITGYNEYKKSLSLSGVKTERWIMKLIKIRSLSA